MRLDNGLEQTPDLILGARPSSLTSVLKPAKPLRCMRFAESSPPSSADDMLPRKIAWSCRDIRQA